MSLNKSLNKLTGAILLALASQTASASGFALIEQSASGQGLSYAGAAANAEDASVMWFNPAGLTEIQGHQVIIGGHIISPQAKFTDDGSFSLAPPSYTTKVPTGGIGDDGATIGFVPNMYWKGKAGDYDIGLGINVPFGQHLSYDDDWAGRYVATETNLKTININPAIAGKINDKLSFGFGLNAQYVDLILEQEFNTALVGGSDGDQPVKIKADSWGYGYNFGFLWKPKDTTNVGFSYRSSVTQDAKGTIDYPTVLDSNNGKVSSTVNLPASASLSVSHDYNRKIKLLADATWTKWSDYGSLTIQDASGTTFTDTKQDFKDSWRLSVGGIYQLNDDMKLRTGIAFDQTPVSNETHRSPRTPDSDRKWVSVGLGYKMSKSMDLDVAYSHLFADETKVNYSADGANTLVGSYEAAVDIFSAQLVWKY
ncbi:OmpP1/FadL family transporter [Thiomicrorhabdus sp. Milos-T2]|uniref:OmpP1/FadL family transporter n=1 Tax=Thiomicrorhabdus sp. Milos-T2 TaxID=90814 RepID=UPI000494C40B|nr:OmpP1/FadL family transporter [Thiomicrorhabdus sp. Milos-T2]